jgi:hypothetical protein
LELRHCISGLSKERPGNSGTGLKVARGKQALGTKQRHVPPRRTIAFRPSNLRGRLRGDGGLSELVIGPVFARLQLCSGVRG